MLRPSNRGGVPVLKRFSSIPASVRLAGKRSGAEIAKTAAFILVLPNMHQAAQKSAGGDDNSLAEKLDVEIRAAADDLPSWKINPVTVA
jgi:hypothetical protein